MDAREKEQYLREYSILKNQGKPFFPYAIAKDGAMACVTLAVIITLSIVLGAELGPKADPTTTTYTPRPEWYFFFLFELLRVVKPPALVFLATIGIPTICLVLLLLLPFIDREPGAQPAAAADRDHRRHRDDRGDGLPHDPGSARPARRRRSTNPRHRGSKRGQEVMASSGCLGCHKVGENGNTLGPNLTEIGDKLGRDAIARTLVNPTSPMPSYQKFQQENPEQFDQLVEYVASLKSE